MADPSREPRAGRNRLEHLAFLLVWLPYLFVVRHLWFVCDDAYISFRFCRNWSAGHGLRYNLADPEPIEGFSNFSWVALGALFDSVGLDLELWMPLASLALGTLLLYLVFRLVRGILGLELWVACLATAFLGCSAPFAAWSTSGLETMLFSLLLFGTFERLILRPAGMAPIAAGLLASLLAMSRPEGIYWALLLIPLALFSRRLRGEGVGREILVYAGVLVAVFAAYSTWRYLYFGSFFGSTVQSKMVFSAGRFLRGFRYVAVQYLTSLSLFIVLPGLLVAFREKRRAIALPVAVMSIAISVYSMVVSGDFMAFGRFLIPALAFNALLFAWVLEDLRQGAPWRRGVAVGFGLLFLVLGLLPGWDVHPVPRATRAKFHFRRNWAEYRSEYAQWALMSGNGVMWGMIGMGLESIASPGDSLVMNTFGAAGYQSDLHLLEGYGFITPGVAEHRRRVGLTEDHPELRSPGHDAPLPPRYFVERGDKPTFLRALLVNPDPPAELVDIVGRNNFELLDEGALHQSYAPEIFGLPGRPDHPDEGVRVLVVWRRNPPGTTTEAAWSRIRVQLDDFVERGEIQGLDMELPPGPRAGLPGWLQ